jgi:DNA helicase-2/ATP-dependent DNA helicase PcrA
MDTAIESQFLPTYLTEHQREAILHEGSPLLIIAGPGSGKTEVLAWRVANLVRSGKFLPENILAVTFTERAALGLKDRIQQKLPNTNVEAMQVSTIHGFASQLLRRYRAQSPLPHGFRLLDGTGQFLYVYSNRNDLGLGDIVKGRLQDFFAAVLRLFNLATEELVAPEKLVGWCSEQLAHAGEKEIDLWNEREVVAEAYRRYSKMLQENGLIDFAFLQHHALTLLEGNPEIVERLRQKYQSILVDEYQDTNAAQERIIKNLAGDGQNLTVVGDDDQSIYRFRGATVKNILTFAERYPNTHKVVLVHNFRSREPILYHSLDVINRNPARFPKALQAVRGPGNEVLLVYEYSAEEEADSTIRLLKQLHEAGRIAKYSDVVILLRSVKSYAGPYVEALEGAGIPFQVIGDASLFEHEEVAQVYDLFNFLGTTKAWGDRFLRDPLVGLRVETAKALREYKESLFDLINNNDEQALSDIGISDSRDRARLLSLLGIKHKVQAQQQGSALEVFYDLLAAIDCIAAFERAGNSVAISNLGVLSQLIAAWDEFGSTRNFYPLREYLKMVKDSGVDPTLPPAEDSIRIMTIHQAKGLEFPVVVLGAAMDGRLPATRRADPYEIPNCLRASGGTEPGVIDLHLADERKLFYVAATRARDLLIVGTADVVNKRGGGPSQFLYEMFGSDLRAAATWSEERVKEIESRSPAGQDVRLRHSFSQLAYYLQCPMRYKFAVVYGLEVPWLDPVDFGANVHRCLEAIHQRFLQGQPTTPEELPGVVEMTWLPTGRSQPEQEAAYQEAAIRQLSRYLEEDAGILDRSMAAETLFSFPFQEDVFLGKVDLVRRCNHSGIELVDFKTSASANAEMEQVELQLGLYALGMGFELSDPVTRLTAHFLEDAKKITWDWTPEHKSRSEAELADLLTRIHGQQFPPRLAYCRQCSEFRNICPYYEDQVLRGEP